MAEQYFHEGDFVVDVLPHNDSYVIEIRLGRKIRRVFFDPAGRITHTRAT